MLIISHWILPMQWKNLRDGIRGDKLNASFRKRWQLIQADHNSSILAILFLGWPSKSVKEMMPHLMLCGLFSAQAAILHLYFNFEKSSWKNEVWQTGFLVYFELDFFCMCSLQKIISKWFLQVKNPVHGTWFFKLDISKVNWRWIHDTR